METFNSICHDGGVPRVSLTFFDDDDGDNYDDDNENDASRHSLPPPARSHKDSGDLCHSSKASWQGL